MAQANYFASELKIQLWINGHLHLHPHDELGSRIAFLLLALEIAVPVFLLLRVFSYIWLTNVLLRSVAGAASLIGFGPQGGRTQRYVWQENQPYST
jgi:hypothetical protein